MFHSVVLNSISSSRSSEHSIKGLKLPDTDYSPHVALTKPNQRYRRRTDVRNTEHKGKRIKDTTKEVTVSNGHVKRENHVNSSKDTHETIEVNVRSKFFTYPYCIEIKLFYRGLCPKVFDAKNGSRDDAEDS